MITNEESKKYLICGLGNIGAEYSNTRHNIGFDVLEHFADSLSASFLPDKLGAMAKIRYKGKQLFLLKPSTYMNLSGKAIKYWMQKEKIPVENILVIVDDIALPTGMLRMKKKGGDAGHNGLCNIIEILSSENFPRLRFGIGSNFAKGQQVNFVLGKWTTEENSVINPKIKNAADAIHCFIFEGIDKAMNLFNNT